MKKLFILLILSIPSLCYGTHTVNDSGVVSGVVRDESGQPLDFASITLMSMTDSLIYSSAVSGSDGSFSVACPSDRALLRVDYIGCKRVEMECSRGGHYEIRMLPDTVSFGEVLVTGHKRIIKNTPDGLSVDVKGTVLEKLGTADDILKSLPFVRKEQDKYEVEGKGTALIYLNGRKIQNISELDQLSSENIKRVELIENPGAKYDASARVVIKIVTARKEGEGFGFENRSSLYASEMPDLTEQLNFNYRHKGFDLLGMVRLVDDKGYQKGTDETVVETDTLWRRSGPYNYRMHSTALDFRLGSNFAIRESSFGIQYTCRLPLKDKSVCNLSSDSYCNGVFSDYYENNFYRRENNKATQEISAYYSGKIGSMTADFNADFLHNGKNPHTDYVEYDLNGLSREMSTDSKTSNTIVAARLDLSLPLLGGNLGFGAELSSIKRDDDYISGISEIPTSYFSLRENTVSAYMEYSRDIKICDMKLGLRYENVNRKYRSNGELLEEQSGNSGRFFPNVTFHRSFGKFSASASYSSYVSRPPFALLQNAVSYNSKYYWQSGNPYLTPTLYHTLGLRLSYDVYRLTLEYSLIDDNRISWGYVIPQSGGVVVFKPAQIDLTKSLQLTVMATPRFGIFTTSFGARLYRYWANSPISGFRSPQKPYLLVNVGGNAAISPTFSAGLLIKYLSRGDVPNARISRGVFDAEISATKTFLADRLSLKLALYDIFRRGNQCRDNYFDGAYSTSLEVFKTREVELTIRYKFNTTPSKYKGKGAGSKEKQRL